MIIKQTKRGLSKSQKRPLLDDELAQIATARFAGLAKTGKVTPLGTLSRRFSRAEAVISRAIATALRRGLVDVRIARDDERPPERQSDLERDLLRRYPCLLAAICARTPAPPSGDPEEAGIKEHSDKVHKLLGLALASEISRGTLIKNGDRIGVGPGRGVYETARALLRQSPLRAAGVTLVSLSGVGYLRHHNDNRNLLLDPDFTAVLLGEAFERPVAVELVSSPLIEQKFPKLPMIQRATGERGAAIDLGIFGVGAMVPGHRFHHEASPSPPARHEPLYNPIRESLRSLLRMVDLVKTPEYIPIGDIGYHLFFVSPPPHHCIPVELQKTILRQVDTINDHLLSAHAPTLRSIRSVVLIAGTAIKARAVHELLTGNLVAVRHLCTDALTAQELLTF